MTMVDEVADAWRSRAQVRERVDAALDDSGAMIVAVLEGRTPEETLRERWADDPANEQGASGLMALASGRAGGGR